MQYWNHQLQDDNTNICGQDSTYFLFYVTYYVRNPPTDMYRFFKENFYYFKSNNDENHVKRTQQNMVRKKNDQLMAKIFEETFYYKDKDIFGNKRMLMIYPVCNRKTLAVLKLLDTLSSYSGKFLNEHYINFGSYKWLNYPVVYEPSKEQLIKMSFRKLFSSTTTTTTSEFGVKKPRSPARKHCNKPLVWTHLDDLKLAQYERLDNDFNREVFYAYQERCISNLGKSIEEQERIIEQQRFESNQHRLEKTNAGAVNEGDKAIYSIYGPVYMVLFTWRRASPLCRDLTLQVYSFIEFFFVYMRGGLARIREISLFSTRDLA